jgi:hypothetical protein
LIHGAGDFSDASSITHAFVGTSQLAIRDWTMFEAEPTTAGTSTVVSEIGGFLLRLATDATFTKSGSTYYTRAAGSLAFMLGADVDGSGSAVMATNKGSVAFYKVKAGASGCPTSAGSGCIANRPFTIQYDDVMGGHWEVDVPGVVWAP